MLGAFSHGGALVADRISPKPKVRNRMMFRKDDPMRYLHVPKSERLSDDGVAGDDHDAIDPITHDRDRDFDRDEVRARGGVVDPADLQ